MTEIIKTTQKLSEKITLALKSYKASGLALHVSFVSALWHVTRHGDVSLLNRIYTGLRQNDRIAVKLYLRRCFIINGLAGKDPDGLSHEAILMALEGGKVVDMKKDLFFVVNGPNTEQSTGLMKLLEERFLAPTGKDKRIFDRNNFNEIKTLNDQDILKRIIALGTAIKGNDNTVVEISDGTKTFVSDIVGKAEHQLSQHQLAS